jgi:hypothetical protein
MKRDSIRRPTHSAAKKHVRNDPGRSAVKQEIAAEMQAKRNDRDDESDFGEQATEQNSYPVNS